MSRRADMPEDSFPLSGFADVIERLDLGVICLDRDLHVTYANSACSRMVKVKRDEIMHRRLEDIIPEDAPGSVLGEVDRSRKNARTVVFDAYCPSPVDLLLRFRSIPVAGGVGLFIEDVTGVEDITGIGEPAGTSHADSPGPPGRISGGRVVREAHHTREGLRPVFHEAVAQGVLEFDEQGRLFSSNREASHILGMDLERMEGLTARKLFTSLTAHFDSNRLVRKMIDLAVGQGISGGKPAGRLHTRVTNTRTGERRWFSLDSVVQPEKKGGGCRHVFVVMNDVNDMVVDQVSLKVAKTDLEQAVKLRTHELMQANRILAEQAEILQKVIDSIPVMLILYDAAGEVRMANREVKHLTGWTAEKVPQRDILSSFFPDPMELGRFWHTMIQSRPGWHDFHITTRFGSVLPSQWVGTRLTDGSVIAIGIDVSARKEMEQDIRRLAAAIEQAVDGIVLIDHALVIRYVNHASEKLCEKSRGEMVGRHIDSLQVHLQDEDAAGERGRLGDLLQSHGGAYSGVFRRRRRSGTVASVTVSIAPVYDRLGKVINYVVVLRDITDMLKLRDQLSQAQKMEAIGILAGGIAHDLKNTFTPILLNAEGLILEMGEESPVYPLLEEIRAATLHGVDLVNHILTFSRRQPQQKRPVNVVPVIEEALRFLRSSLPASIGIRKRLKVRDARVLADATQIKQVLINLGTNAGDAMRERGGIFEVGLFSRMMDAEAVGRISPDLPPGRYLVIRVSDTGKGMDGTTLENMFNPFFTTKAPGQGTGLGLSVVHGIVKDHRGAVTVRSTPGKGTTFTVYLPELPPPENEGTQAS